MRSCSEFPSRQLLKAVSQFNGGEWFECHETLEELWLGETGEMRDFYQGILQVGVALHHWRNSNYRGAVGLLETGIAYLRNVQPVCQRVNVDGLIQAAELLKNELIALGPGHMAELEQSLIPRIMIQ